MRRRSWSAGWAAVMAAVLWCLAAPVSPARAAGLAWPDAPVSSTEAAGAACADVLFVGVRGSVETSPYGRTVQSWRDTLAARTAPGAADGAPATVREIDLVYPATAPETILSAGLPRVLFDPELPRSEFTDSVTAGIEALAGVLEDSRSRCPQERWVLVGYSQGAQVINQTLAGDLADDQLLAAVLLGNPGHFQGQQVTEFGTAGEMANGLMASLYYIRAVAAAGREAGGQDQAQADGVRAMLELGQNQVRSEVMTDAAEGGGLAVDPARRDAVESICAAGDLVCDAGPGLYRVLLSGDLEPEIRRAAGPHGSYGADRHPEAVDRVVDRLGTVRPPGTPRVPLPTETPVIAAMAGVAACLAVIVAVGTAVVIIARRRRAEESAGTDAPDPSAGPDPDDR